MSASRSSHCNNNEAEYAESNRIAGTAMPQYNLIGFAFKPGDRAALHTGLAEKWMAAGIVIAAEGTSQEIDERLAQLHQELNLLNATKTGKKST